MVQKYIMDVSYPDFLNVDSGQLGAVVMVMRKGYSESHVAVVIVIAVAVAVVVYPLGTEMQKGCEQDVVVDAVAAEDGKDNEESG